MIINPYRFATSGGGGGFDPLSIGWAAAYWAEDPNWTDPGDGNAVSQWDDGSGNGNHVTQGTAVNRPTFRSSVAALNGQPAVEADGGDWLQSSAFASALAVPNQIVIVAKSSVVDSNYHEMIDGVSNRQTVRIRDNNSWEIYSGGSVVNGGTADTDAHLFRARFNSGELTSLLEVDGTNVASGDAGSGSMDGVTLFASPAGSIAWNGHIAFVGVMDGDLTAGERSDLETWASDHYGITIA